MKQRALSLQRCRAQHTFDIGYVTLMAFTKSLNQSLVDFKQPLGSLLAGIKTERNGNRIICKIILGRILIQWKTLLQFFHNSLFRNPLIQVI